MSCICLKVSLAIRHWAAVSWLVIAGYAEDVGPGDPECSYGTCDDPAGRLGFPLKDSGERRRVDPEKFGYRAVAAPLLEFFVSTAVENKMSHVACISERG